MSHAEWQNPALKQNTQKQQNPAFTPRDVKKAPGEEQAPPQLVDDLDRLAEEKEARTPQENYDGRQIGGDRAEHEVYSVARAERFPKVEPQPSPDELSLRQRVSREPKPGGDKRQGQKAVPGGEKPGISNAPGPNAPGSNAPKSEAQPGKRPVESKRPDAQAGAKKNAG
jgi:hypothetical protein